MAAPTTVLRRVAIGAAAVFCSCSSAGEVATACQPSAFRSMPPRIIAHAGGEGLGPANTILAMQRSLDAGADILDADLRMTADAVIVPAHDRDLNRVLVRNARSPTMSSSRS